MEENQNLFTNPPIDLHSLPSVETLEFTALEPSYKTVRLVGAGIFSIVLLLAGMGLIFFRQHLGVFALAGFGVIGGLAIWNLVYHAISFPYMSYALREKDISYQSGWMWKSAITIPFNRVQHCDIKQGLLDRQFGLSKLTIYTAGGQNSDMEIPGLTPETAEKMKSYILGATEHAVENE